jgi:deoxyribonuclease-1
LITYRGNGRAFKVTSRVAIPDKSIQGDIARIGFYMRDAYGVTYSRRQLELFSQWHDNDPVSNEEIQLNNKIIKVQGRGNQYIK